MNEWHERAAMLRMLAGMADPKTAKMFWDLADHCDMMGDIEHEGIQALPSQG